MRHTFLAACLVATLPIGASSQPTLKDWVDRCDEPAVGKPDFLSNDCLIFRNGMEWQLQKQQQNLVTGSTVMVHGTRGGQPVILQETANIPFRPRNPEIYYEFARDSDLLNSLDSTEEPPLIVVTPSFEVHSQYGGAWQPSMQRWDPTIDPPQGTILEQEDIR